MMYGKDKAMAKGGVVKKAKPAAKAKKGMAMGGTVAPATSAPNQQQMSAMAAKMAAIPGPTAQQLASAPKATQVSQGQMDAQQAQQKKINAAPPAKGLKMFQRAAKKVSKGLGKPSVMRPVGKAMGMAKGGMAKKGKK